MMSRVWFFTGSSRGLGKQWTCQALRTGDCVIATARNIEDLNYINNIGSSSSRLAVQCDVTDFNSVDSAIEAGLTKFGHIDVVVNAAGIGMFAPLEDSPIDDVRRLFEVNVIGSWKVIQSMLRVTSQDTAWTLLQISSIAGIRGFADMSAYAASKWAVEGMIESLNDELSDRPIRVHLVEPGPYLTDWVGSSAIRPQRSNRYLSEEQTKKRYWPRMKPERPELAATALTEILEHGSVPLRVTVGATAAKCWVQYRTNLGNPAVVCDAGQS